MLLQKRTSCPPRADQTILHGSGKTLVFLTNRTDLEALTICDLYKSRWQVVFIKVKQKPPRERGRPARTKTGTASVISTRETVSLDELVRVARVYALTAVAYC